MYNILLTVILLWIGFYVLESIVLYFSRKVRTNKTAITKAHQSLSKEMNLGNSKRWWFNFGGIHYHPYFNRISISLKSLQRHSAQDNIYLLARAIKKQELHQQGIEKQFPLQGQQETRNKYIVYLTLWSIVTLAWLQVLGVSVETVEKMQSVVLFPSNFLILKNLYLRFFSKAYKQEVIHLEEVLDDFANQRVGGAERYWSNYKSRWLKLEPSKESRINQAKKYPLKITF